MLKYIQENHSVEVAAKKFKVPVVVIEDWINRNKAESYLNAYFAEVKPSRDSRGEKLKSFFKKVAALLKEYFGHVGLLVGIIVVIFLCFFFRSDTEFIPSADSMYNMAPQVDSISIRSIRIESLLERHKETVNDISNTAAGIIVNQEQQSRQLKTLIRKSSDIENLCKESISECDTSK